MPDPTPTKNPDPDSHGSHGGGGGTDPGAAAVGGGTSGPVSNQPQLALDHSTFTHLPRHHLHAIKVVQLEFARDVSARAAAAYDQVLAVLRTPDHPPEPQRR